MNVTLLSQKMNHGGQFSSKSGGVVLCPKSARFRDLRIATMNAKREVLRILTCIALLSGLIGCSKASEIIPEDVRGYNYTEDYIDQFRITGEEENLSSGGPNIYPKRIDRERSGSGAMCCIGVPAHWRPDMKLIVRWRRDTHPYDSNDRTGDQWLTATTIVPPYGSKTYGFYVHFLPGDRIRVQIKDTPPDLLRPSENDPYVVQGVIDSELNKKRITE